MHFITTVIVDEPKLSLVKEALEPFQEDYIDDCPGKYKKFHSVYEECKNEYDKENEATKIEYPTLKNYIKNYCGYEYNTKMKDYGYWKNPNEKFDRYNICPKGTTERYIPAAEENAFVQIKDFSKCYNNIDKYDDYIRFWEIVVEGKPLKEGEEKPFNLYSKEYYINIYGDKDTFATLSSAAHCCAFIFDGKWYERGKMNMFGGVVTKESIIEYIKNWQEVINEPKNQNKYIALVNCHY